MAEPEPQPKPKQEPELRPGETLLAEWRPVLGIYIGRVVFIASIWMLIAGGLGGHFSELAHAPYFALAAFGLSLAHQVIAYEDGSEWLRRRGDLWRLTSERLIYENDRDAERAPVSVELVEIRRARAWMFWAVRVQFNDGQTTMLQFLPRARQVRDQIACALNALQETRGA
ncbi:hypothetical protein AIOL_003145 [Candidatus Rhodobacter oscarellae]|uniref:DUF2244 domain-containing protein n=1 Tax=Candidatus Rhodobacter oscarellae TaxID=1675527 RepID=A0A0J9E933_9RHOB|nr:hypothetical protein [Candidatus Rhodobacter lobularis]KMW58174.1 hypothetical protein AIOL_003145 [Candidatus Rhodobacter lobularis]